MSRNLHILHPTSAWGGGHVLTCINILKGMHAHGRQVHLDLNRTQLDMGPVPHKVSLPRPVSQYGLARLEPWMRRRTEARFLRRLRPGDLAWLWPGVSLETFHAVKAAGAEIIMEGINTRMAWAKPILDAAYEAEGLEPAHRITQARIDEEEEMLSMAQYFFTPSPNVDVALTAEGSAFQGTPMHSSYGAWANAGRRLPRGDGAPLTVIFVGSVCIRKGAHLLLKAWEKAGFAEGEARLLLCGAVEPAIAKVNARQLALPNVEAPGHVKHVMEAFGRADIFVMPSLEEGDPQVTYEAASCGLPILASSMGGGRLAGRTDAVISMDPTDIDQMSYHLRQLVGDAGMREEYGGRTLAAATQFDWDQVGAERVALLRALSL